MPANRGALCHVASVVRVGLSSKADQPAERPLVAEEAGVAGRRTPSPVSAAVPAQAPGRRLVPGAHPGQEAVEAAAADDGLELGAVGDEEAHPLGHDVDDDEPVALPPHAPVDRDGRLAAGERDTRAHRRVVRPDRPAARHAERAAAGIVVEAAREAVPRVAAEQPQVFLTLRPARLLPVPPEDQPRDQVEVGGLLEQPGDGAHAPRRIGPAGDGGQRALAQPIDEAGRVPGLDRRRDGRIRRGRLDRVDTGRGRQEGGDRYGGQPPRATP